MHTYTLALYIRISLSLPAPPSLQPPTEPLHNLYKKGGKGSPHGGLSQTNKNLVS